MIVNNKGIVKFFYGLDKITQKIVNSDFSQILNAIYITDNVD